MAVFKAMVPMEDGLYRMDVVEHDSMFWLVPAWIDTPRKGWSRPVRLVCLSLLPHQDLRSDPHNRFVVNCPVPRSVLSGPIPPQIAAQYVVIDLPDLEFETHASGPVH